MILARTNCGPDRAMARDSGELYSCGKLRIRFRKDGSLRFLGHHDLMRLWERLLRRTNLPIKYGRGFRARPRISFPLSLSLGIVGWEEILEVELERPVSLEVIHEKLGSISVEGLSLVNASLHPVNERTEIAEVEYLCPLPDGIPLADLTARRDEILAAESIKILRRHPRKPNREVDIRPMLLDVVIVEREVRCRVRVTPSGSVRVEEVLALLGVAQRTAEDRTGVIRTRVRLAGD